MLGMTPVVYFLIDGRLHVELDRQLRIDWSLIEAHLELDPAGRVLWNKSSPATLSSPGYAETWFEVWSGSELLLSHFPTVDQPIRPLRSPKGETLAVYSVETSLGTPLRTLERIAHIGGRKVTLRVLRDESGLHRTLREILIGLALGIPFTAVLAAFGGYLMAGRMLSPVSVMVKHARDITLDSLDQRLPNPNPNDELGQLAAVFNETLQRLEQSFELLKRFTADASHELRTPLTALRTVGEVALREEADADSLRETIGSILEEAQHLGDLIDSLLLLARVESGRFPFHIESVRLDEIAAEACERLGLLAMEKGQEIVIVPNYQAVVSIDRKLTQQAVTNILDNAIRHSQPGAKILVRSFRTEVASGIEISDNGPGIALEYARQVFERFFRIDRARSRTDGGTGLGLAIAKLFIEQQGGTIRLESLPGQGCTFGVSFRTSKITSPA